MRGVLWEITSKRIKCMGGGTGRLAKIYEVRKFTYIFDSQKKLWWNKKLAFVEMIANIIFTTI